MERVYTLAIDLAKQSFQFHGVFADGSVAFQKKLGRAKMLGFLETVRVDTFTVSIATPALPARAFLPAAVAGTAVCTERWFRRASTEGRHRSAPGREGCRLRARARLIRVAPRHEIANPDTLWETVKSGESDDQASGRSVRRTAVSEAGPSPPRMGRWFRVAGLTVARFEIGLGGEAGVEEGEVVFGGGSGRLLDEAALGQTLDEAMSIKGNGLRNDHNDPSARHKDNLASAAASAPAVRTIIATRRQGCETVDS